jgi:membrane protein
MRMQFHIIKFHTIKALAVETFTEWNNHKASRLAAALAYYTIISLPALVILIIALAGMILGEDAARGQVVEQLQSLLGHEGAKSIEEMISGASKAEAKSLRASILSSVTLAFGATAVVIQLQDALNTIWEVTAKPGSLIKAFIFNRILSFGMILSVGFLLLVSLVVSALLAMLSDSLGVYAPDLKVLWRAVDFSVSLILIAGLFALMFKYLPDAKIDWSDVIIGAILTSLLFNIGKLLIGLYLGNSQIGTTYGATGSLVILLVWIYYSAQIFFLGAQFTQVYARRHGSRIEPKAFAKPVTTDAKAKQGLKQ